LQRFEINTSQNVKIEYQLASVFSRILAFFIDFIVMALGFIILMLIINNVFEIDSDVFMNLFAFVWLGFFTLASEMIGQGQSIGKKAVGLKIVKINGDKLTFYDYFSRWSMRLMDIYFSVGAIAVLLIGSNNKAQRIGDILAGTTVIKVKGDYNFSLSEILKLNQKRKESYEFQFPLAYRLSDNDVIVLKSLLYRMDVYNNSEHIQALDLAVERLKEILELTEVPKNKKGFISKVISEYVVLTR
jgi:uncharacterized RDD family membrane protein YckC